MRLFLAITTTLAAAIAAGCADAGTPTQAAAPATFGKPAPVVHPNAIWVWHAHMTDQDPLDGVAPERARIFGDGRDSDGTPRTGDARYTGGQCGVLAQIRSPADGWGGDAPFDPDYSAAPSSCGGPRKLNFVLSGSAGESTVASAADTWAHRLNRMEVGAEVVRYLAFGNVPISNCKSLRYGVMTTSGATLDEQIVSADPTTGVLAKRVSTTEWALKSVNGGKAQCFNQAKNGSWTAGNVVYLPFRVTVYAAS